MRKFLLLLISFGLIGLFLILGIKTLGSRTVFLEEKKSQEVELEKKVIPEVSIILDFGENKIEDKVFAKNAFLALEEIAKENNFSLETKQYDFGIFVEAINSVKNTKDKAWIYFVNGKTGEVAADKYELKENDVVEWKYTKPLF